ncbi:MAG: knotted carbamoyltransferase YgeW [Bacteriovoracaceae bacterium]|nr:knotted carbamoyltransferase YgeW [Bacteriovoracaceae bacterium]
MTVFKELVEQMEGLDSKLFGKDFLLTWDKSLDDIRQTLSIAKLLKYLRDSNMSAKVINSGLAISLFRDNSTRTRFSFASAANLLGLTVQDLDEAKSQIAHGETVRETANMISFMSDIIGIRDDMYIGLGHEYMLEVGRALDEGFSEGVLPRRPGIINLQCDIDHPTQSLADLLHLDNYFGGLENLKGKKMAMTWAYSPSYGKPLSVPQGIIGLMTRLGMEITLAHPEGYNLIPDVISKSSEFANNSGGSFKVTNSMDEAFKGADIVYPKSWAPYTVMQERTQLVQNQEFDGLKDLEQNCLAQNAKFKDWECTEEKMSLTKDKKALYMHCLPADITGVSCKEGEVAKSVFERYRIDTYKEASAKPYIIAAMMMGNLFEDPKKILGNLRVTNKTRMGINK